MLNVLVVVVVMVVVVVDVVVPFQRNDHSEVMFLARKIARNQTSIKFDLQTSSHSTPNFSWTKNCIYNQCRRMDSLVPL